MGGSHDNHNWSHDSHNRSHDSHEQIYRTSGFNSRSHHLCVPMNWDLLPNTTFKYTINSTTNNISQKEWQTMFTAPFPSNLKNAIILLGTDVPTNPNPNTVEFHNNKSWGGGGHTTNSSLYQKFTITSQSCISEHDLGHMFMFTICRIHRKSVLYHEFPQSSV